MLEKRGLHRVVDWIARAILILPIILHFVLPIRMILEFPSTLIGLVPIIAGLFINLRASRTLLKREGGTFKTPKILVTEGPFKYSRHPIYLGAIVAAFGFAILLVSLVAFGFPVIIFLIAHFLVVPPEEEQLKAIFGEEYLDYMKRVRRWI